jgi:hypothetical protein
MHWFGEPWPAPERRAPVCANDRERVPVPIGMGCGACRRPLDATAQGVLIPHLSLQGPIVQRAYHLRCFLRQVLGAPAAAADAADA